MQNDLMDAVTRKLDELFSGKYPIYTKNVEQGIEMPCFFIGFKIHPIRHYLGLAGSAHGICGCSSFRKNIRIVPDC